LFQGRYQGILVERDAYLLELARYVVLNPVRAGLVAEAGDWPWGSYGSMVGTTSIPNWLGTDWMLSRYGDRPRAQLAYIGFVRGGIGLPSIWEALRTQI
jgi:hypothetical protein